MSLIWVIRVLYFLASRILISLEIFLAYSFWNNYIKQVSLFLNTAIPRNHYKSSLLVIS